MRIGDDEERLVEQAKQGNRAAFLRLIQPYYERVYATAKRLLANPDDAAEVTQEAVLRTFWKIRSFHGRAHFYTWLYRTALNLCYRRLSDTQAKIHSRSLSLDQSSEGEEEGSPREAAVAGAAPSPRDDAIREEETEIVRQAMADLGRDDFQILVLREFEDLSYDQIADRLGLPKGTVMSRLHRARIVLAERLRELGLE